LSEIIKDAEEAKKIKVAAAKEKMELVHRTTMTQYLMTMLLLYRLLQRIQ